DTLTVMMYNLLYYGVNTSFCTASNNSLTTKNTRLQTLFSYLAPDILGVCEMSPVSSVNAGFLNNVLNSGGRSGYLRANLMNPSGSEIFSLLYYNSNKVGIKSQTPVATQGRDIAFYRLYHKPIPANNDTVWLYVAVAHLKAGGTASDIAQRGQEAGSLVQYWRSSGLRGNVLVMGDLNVSSSSEPAFDSLLNAGTLPNHRMKDPVSRLGSWSGNSSFALWHTQSPRTTSNGCASGGGMDDRYDHILVNDFIMGDSLGVRYVPASFRVLGNDGNRFNGNVNGTFNASVPVAIANALYDISDHLPVVLKLAVGPVIPSTVHDEEGVSIAPGAPWRLVCDPVRAGVWSVQIPESDRWGLWHWTLRGADGRILQEGRQECRSGDCLLGGVNEAPVLGFLELSRHPLDSKSMVQRRVLGAVPPVKHP
ncbi:MAG: endonuclease/exonuclease/phosphatase family protein, partial [Bacteroidota bacterium]